MTGCELARSFVEAIDSRDFGRIDALITDDHVFTVNAEQHRGRDALRQAWSGWWELAPNLRTRIEEIIDAGDHIVVRMIASGSMARWNGTVIPGEWSFPVAAIAKVREGRISEWREYCDPSPLWMLFRG